MTRCQQGLILFCILDISEVYSGHILDCADFTEVPIDRFKCFRYVARLLANIVEAESEACIFHRLDDVRH